MLLNLDTTEKHNAWLAEVWSRLGELRSSPKYRDADPEWVPEDLLLLASGLFRVLSGTGRFAQREEYRIELLASDAQTAIRKLRGESVEWVSIQDAAQAEDAPRSSQRRSLKDRIIQLLQNSENCRIERGAMTWKASYIRALLNAEQKQKLDALLAARG